MATIHKYSLLCRLGLHRWGQHPQIAKFRKCEKCGWDAWK